MRLTRLVNCRHVLVFEERNLATRYVEALLLRLGKECPLIHREFRIIDKGVGRVVVFHCGIPALVRGKHG